jgi:hypothetical protein
MAVTTRNLISRILFNAHHVTTTPCDNCGTIHSTFKAVALCGAPKDDRFITDPRAAHVLSKLSDALAEGDKLVPVKEPKAAKPAAKEATPAKAEKKAPAKKAVKKAAKKAATKSDK